MAKTCTVDSYNLTAKSRFMITNLFVGKTGAAGCATETHTHTLFPFLIERLEKCEMFRLASDLFRRRRRVVASTSSVSSFTDNCTGKLLNRFSSRIIIQS